MPNPSPVHPRVICDICKKPVSSKYMTTHRRKMHNVYVGTGRKYHPSTIQATVIDIQPVKPVKEVGVTFQVADNFLLLEDSNGGIWLAERIK